VSGILAIGRLAASYAALDLNWNKAFRGPGQKDARLTEQGKGMFGYVWKRYLRSMGFLKGHCTWCITMHAHDDDILNVGNKQAKQGWRWFPFCCYWVDGPAQCCSHHGRMHLRPWAPYVDTLTASWFPGYIIAGRETRCLVQSAFAR
jgi:hypothetical protein